MIGIHRASFENAWAGCFWVPRNWNGITWCRWPWKKVQLSVPTTWTGRPFNQSKKRSKLPFIFHSLSIMMPTLLLWVNVGKGLVKPTWCCLHDTWYRCWRWYRRWRSSLARCAWSCWGTWSHHGWLWWSIQCTCGKKAVLKRLPQQLGSLTWLVVTQMSTKGTLNWKSWSTTEKK